MELTPLCTFNATRTAPIQPGLPNFLFYLQLSVTLTAQDCTRNIHRASSSTRVTVTATTGYVLFLDVCIFHLSRLSSDVCGTRFLHHRKSTAAEADLPFML